MKKEKHTNQKAKVFDFFRNELKVLEQLHPDKPALWELGERWREEDLERVESRFGFQVPSEYRDWLLEVGDGGAGFFCEKGEEFEALRPIMKFRNCTKEKLEFASSSPVVRANGWLGVEPAEKIRKKFPDIHYTIGSENQDRLHSGFLLLGSSEEGAQVLIQFNPPHPGRLWIDTTNFDGAFLPIEQSFLELQRSWLTAMRNQSRWELWQHGTHPVWRAIQRQWSPPNA